ncbi:hypothetical protein BO99DRAFT_19824 [Aspergillus violaceofuscus CBS 115571]|uniref:Secreted protein n=1 Tax=Aspergillus violaceofuscus (strain CBS 115571) TaxID=1450538 RepID=A0A2V5IEB6_ASPV1|nr:hypothetical protein BO99DRAFT_19824 [Aspergillus violaceofuscus CBS 115571]
MWYFFLSFFPPLLPLNFSKAQSTKEHGSFTEASLRRVFQGATVLKISFGFAFVAMTGVQPSSPGLDGPGRRLAVKLSLASGMGYRPAGCFECEVRRC